MNTELLSYNLQFFADEAEAGNETPPENTEQVKEVETPNVDDENKKLVEQLTAELAKEKAARQKEKAALDKVLKENGEIKKSLRAKQTEQEIEDEAKREEAEQVKAHIAELEEYKQRNEAKERYLLQGMDAEMAKKAAEAEVSGDMDELAAIQKQHTDALIKAKEAEWKASRPQLNAGSGSGSDMTVDEILAIEDATERRRKIAENIDKFSK